MTLLHEVYIIILCIGSYERIYVCNCKWDARSYRDGYFICEIEKSM